MKASAILQAPVALAALVAGLVSGCSSASGGTDPEPAASREGAATDARATRVETAVLEKTSASFELSLPAEVRGSREALLGTPQGGYVEKVSVEVGDAVQEGQPLFSIDTEMYRARLAQVAAQKKAARRDLARAEKLGSVISVAELDGIRDRLTNAKTSYRIAQLELSRATVRAPSAGVIASVDIEEGEVASRGAPVAKLVRLDPIEVSMAVADRDVVSLSEGMTVDVYATAVPTPRKGKIARLNPAADEETRAFEVEIEVDNPDRALLPGMIARVSLSRDIAEERMLVPQGFLVTKREENGVFLVEDGIARWRPLALGPLVRDQVIVDEGLSVGDEIVTVGQRSLVDGDALIVTRKGRCCEEGRPVYD